MHGAEELFPLPESIRLILMQKFLYFGHRSPCEATSMKKGSDLFVPWGESTWEQKRQELAAVPPSLKAFSFPGHVAQDILNWLRGEFNEAKKTPFASLGRINCTNERSLRVTKRRPLAGKTSPSNLLRNLPSRQSLDFRSKIPHVFRRVGPEANSVLKVRPTSPTAE